MRLQNASLLCSPAAPSLPSASSPSSAQLSSSLLSSEPDTKPGTSSPSPKYLTPSASTCGTVGFSSFVSHASSFSCQPACHSAWMASSPNAKDGASSSCTLNSTSHSSPPNSRDACTSCVSVLTSHDSCSTTARATVLVECSLLSPARQRHATSCTPSHGFPRILNLTFGLRCTHLHCVSRRRVQLHATDVRPLSCLPPSCSFVSCCAFTCASCQPCCSALPPAANCGCHFRMSPFFVSSCALNSLSGGTTVLPSLLYSFFVHSYAL